MFSMLRRGQMRPTAMFERHTEDLPDLFLSRGMVLLHHVFGAGEVDIAHCCPLSKPSSLNYVRSRVKTLHARHNQLSLLCQTPQIAWHKSYSRSESVCRRGHPWPCETAEQDVAWWQISRQPGLTNINIF